MRLARAVVISAVALAVLAIALPHAAAAQGTSASIQGTIVDEAGPLPGATIVAKDTSSGFQYEAVAGVDGTFSLSGPASRHLRDHGDDEPVQAAVANGAGAGRPVASPPTSR